MQQVENCREEEATVDVQFTDLPNALIACKVPEDLFNEGSLKVRTFIYRRRHFIQLVAFWCVGCKPIFRVLPLDQKYMYKYCHMDYGIRRLPKEMLYSLLFKRSLAQDRADSTVSERHIFF